MAKNLPYVFDLLYDIKTVEALHGHLTGTERVATSATDADLLELMREQGVPFPEGFVTGSDPQQELGDASRLLKEIYEHAKPDGVACMDSSWVMQQVKEHFAKYGVELT